MRPEQGDLKTVDGMVVAFQGASQRMRYARVPVVAAPFGMTLGGGAEVCWAATPCRRRPSCTSAASRSASASSRRAAAAWRWRRARRRGPTDDPQFDILSLVRVPFKTIALAKVATSAEEARDLGYLRQGDGVSIARETLLADAKQRALGLARAGYHPPPPRRIRVLGESGAATLRAALHNLEGAHQISAHDAKISAHLARVLSGGAVPAGAAVTEQQMLDLEREAFLSLCGEPKTHERMQYMLQNNKPLRN